MIGLMTSKIIKGKQFKLFMVLMLCLSITYALVILSLVKLVPNVVAIPAVKEALDQNQDMGFFDISLLYDFADMDTLSVEEMYGVGYSGYLVSMLIGLFTVIYVCGELKHNFWDFLVARKISRMKIYFSELCAVSLSAVIMWHAYGILTVISMLVMGFRFSKGTAVIGYFAKNIFFQSLIVISMVSLFFAMAIIIRNESKTIITVVLLCLGLAGFFDFLAAVLGNSSMSIVWIGNCSAAISDPGNISMIPGGILYKEVWVLLLSVIYITVSVILGRISFRSKDM